MHGWSQTTEEDRKVLEIVAATRPEFPVTDIVSTTIIAETRVNVAWSAPTTLGGNGIVITAYRVLLRGVDAPDGTPTFTESPAGSGCNPTAATPAATE